MAIEALEAVERTDTQIEVQDLLWLLDSPLLIDEKQVNSFYNAVVRPDIVDDPTQHDAKFQYVPKSIKIEATKELEERIDNSYSGSLKVGLGLSGILKSLFPSAEGELKYQRDTGEGKTNTDLESIELVTVENPQRQLVHLAVHYLINVTDRLFLVNNLSEEEWRTPANILKSPRALAFLDLPPTMIIPTAIEFENNIIEPVYLKLVAESGERPPRYPEYPKVSEENLPDERRKYWNWFLDNFSASKAIQVIEEAASRNGKIRWIDYRMPINEDGDTLHLHICPNGEYATGVLAYNFIKRGQKHGLRLVGTLKSEPDMNVLAVYEK